MTHDHDQLATSANQPAPAPRHRATGSPSGSPATDELTLSSASLSAAGSARTPTGVTFGSKVIDWISQLSGTLTFQSIFPLSGSTVPMLLKASLMPWPAAQMPPPGPE